jgi:hypothetical protein
MRGPERGVLQRFRLLVPPGEGECVFDFVGVPLVLGVRGEGLALLGVRFGVTLCPMAGVRGTGGDNDEDRLGESAKEDSAF